MYFYKVLSLVGISFFYITFIIREVVYYRILPDQVPDHWDANGNVDDYSSKGDLLITHIVVSFAITLPFLLLSFVLPKIPYAFLNVPNKEYWLNPSNPERAAMSWNYITTFMLVLCNIISCIIWCIFEVTLEMARQQTESFFWVIFILIGVNLLFIITSVVILYRRFSLTQVYPEITS